MVQIARLTTGSNDLAEELVQDAFAELFRRFADVHTPAAYLRLAVMNRCTSWVRRRAVERRHNHQSTTRPEAFSDPNTVEIMEVVARLPKRQRAAIVLRYVTDWSELDIAHALNCRPGTVKSLLSRARIRLAKELNDDH